MPTIQQLVRKGRQDKVDKTKTPALKGSARSAVASAHVSTRRRRRSRTPRLRKVARVQPDQPDRGHRLHPGRRAQPAGALHRARARRPGEGPPGRPLQDHPRRARHPVGPWSASRRAAVTAPRRRRANASQGPRAQASAGHRPGLLLAAGHPTGQQDPVLRQEVARRAHRLRRPRRLPREDRRRPGHHAQARAGQRQADPRGQEPPGRWCHVPGAGRGQGRAAAPRWPCAGWSATRGSVGRRR